MPATEKIVIGVSGVSSAGKTSLCLRLKEAIPNCKVIHQDDFFKPVQEVAVDSNGFYQYDVLAALNMDAMTDAVSAWIGDPAGFTEPTSAARVPGRCSPRDPVAPHVLLIEGFLIYTFRPLLDVFNLRYFLTIPFDEAKRRRSTRVFQPPDPPGYFEGHVWPMFLKHKQDMGNLGVHVDHLDGTRPLDELFLLALEDVSEKIRRAPLAS